MKYYIFYERLDVDGLKALGIGPGPVYAKIKAGQDIVFNGQTVTSAFSLFKFFFFFF